VARELTGAAFDLVQAVPLGPSHANHGLRRCGQVFKSNTTPEPQIVESDVEPTPPANIRENKQIENSSLFSP